MYYGPAEPVIIAGPRNAHRRPLIPPLAILFSSLLAPAPCRPRGTFPPGPSDRPLSLPEASFLRFHTSVSALRAARHDARAHSVIIIGCRSRTPRVPLAFLSRFSSFGFSLSLSSYLCLSRRPFPRSFVCTSSAASRIPLRSITN